LNEEKKVECELCTGTIEEIEEKLHCTQCGNISTIKEEQEEEY
jgi:cytochrome c-type biogenesis protein CcmH/NrfF